MNDKEFVFRQLYMRNVEREQYIDSIPREFREVILFNKYVDSLVHDCNLLVDCVFGEHADSVNWFLYEWQPGYEVGLSEGEQTPINNIDEYVDWMKKNEGF